MFFPFLSPAAAVTDTGGRRPARTLLARCQPTSLHRGQHLGWHLALHPHPTATPLPASQLASLPPEIWQRWGEQHGRQRPGIPAQGRGARGAVQMPGGGRAEDEDKQVRKGWEDGSGRTDARPAGCLPPLLAHKASPLPCALSGFWQPLRRAFPLLSGPLAVFL